MSTIKQATVVFGLGFSIMRSESYLSGWLPSSFDKGLEGLELYADLRIEGFAGLINSHMAEKIVIVSGQWKENPTVSQATVIRDMLVKDYDIPEGRVEAIPSVGNTMGNIDKIRSYIAEHELSIDDCAICTNHYHLPRALTDLAEAGLLMRPLCAESAVLAAQSKLVWPAMLETMRKEFGESSLTDRVIQEIRGVADKYQGSYISSRQSIA